MAIDVWTGEDVAAVGICGAITLLNIPMDMFCKAA